MGDVGARALQILNQMLCLQPKLDIVDRNQGVLLRHFGTNQPEEKCRINAAPWRRKNLHKLTQSVFDGGVIKKGDRITLTGSSVAG